jgi:hypothetical protein
MSLAIKLAYLDCVHDLRSLSIAIEAGGIEKYEYVNKQGTTVTRYLDTNTGKWVKNPSPEQIAEAESDRGRAFAEKRGSAVKKVEQGVGHGFAGATKMMVGGDIKGALTLIGDTVRGNFDVIKDKNARALLMQDLENVVVDIAKDQQKSAEDKMKEIQEAIAKSKQDIEKAVKESPENIKKAAEETANNIKKAVKEEVEKATAGIKTELEKAKTGVDDAVKTTKAEAEQRTQEFLAGHPKVQKAATDISKVLGKDGDLATGFNTAMTKAQALITEAKGNMNKAVKAIQEEASLDMAILSTDRAKGNIGGAFVGAGIGTALGTGMRVIMGLGVTPQGVALGFAVGVGAGMVAAGMDFANSRKEVKKLEADLQEQYTESLKDLYPNKTHAEIAEMVEAGIKELRKGAYKDIQNAMSRGASDAAKEQSENKKQTEVTKEAPKKSGGSVQPVNQGKGKVPTMPTVA